MNRLLAFLGLGLAGFVLLTRRRRSNGNRKSQQRGRTSEDFGAFIERFVIPPPPDPSLPLAGLTFAVKDIFEIEGRVTGFGNPDWARTHEASSCTSPVVLALIQAGATCVGKTVMDEFAYSINGENKHYGTPTNPSAPMRVPGGSSSGSGVAVAAKLVDFSLGTDTGGSVRVPAAFCGIFGFRPSHSTVSSTNVIPMAQSFDTVGWFARNPSILSQVGQVLLQQSGADRLPHHILIADDCFKFLSVPCDEVVHSVIQVAETFGCQIDHKNLADYINVNVPSLQVFMEKDCQEEEHLISTLHAVSTAMRLLQRYEFRNNHGEWFRSVKPDIGPGILERVQEALAVSEENIKYSVAARSEIHSAISDLLKDDSILVMPTVPGPPPKLQTKGIMLDDFRAKAFSLLAISGMSGCCQVTMPLGTYDGCSVGVSFLASPGSDQFLLNTVQKMHSSLAGEATTF
ncbi:amidase 1 [Nymphaea colorata]|nr:amidase 1 [Nymphaea colorata]